VKYLSSSSALALVVALSSISTAHAALVVHSANANASNSCIPSRPAYEGAMRKRPLAVQNEGDTEGFVTCAFESPKRMLTVSMTLRNTATVARTLTCTGVSGAADSPNVYVVKSINVDAGGYAYLDWYPEEFGAAQGDYMPGGGYFATNCNLPTDSGIGRTSVVYQEEVGV